MPLLLISGSDARARAERHSGSTPRLSDEELMARVRSADAEALGLLFDRYARLVRTVAVRILLDPGEAEDSLQDTFLYIHRKASLFDPLKGPAKAWIVQVAAHRAQDKRSWLMRRGFYAGTETEYLADTIAGATDLEREIGGGIDRAILELAFAELPAEQQRTIEMYYFEGLELREIADKLNCPLGNVRHYYYRGLEKLRKSAFVRMLR